ncbi:MAG: hypothetical protein DMD64_03355, partial [Gemmatimonadetes bacterium]
MSGIREVEEQSVPGARATGDAELRIDRDVVALIGAVAHAAGTHGREKLGIDDGLDAAAQRGAVGAVGRRPALTPGDAIEHGIDELWREYDGQSLKLDDVRARRLRGIREVLRGGG